MLISRMAAGVPYAGPLIPFPKSARVPLEIKAAADGKSADVYLYDVIGETWDGSGTTGKSFADEMKKLGKLDAINVYINSPGGSVFDGLAIHNVLLRNTARKVVHIDGLAASIASVIAMAGDEILIAANGMMMIHDPWTIALGTAADMRKTADTLDKVRESILGTYVDRSSSSEDKLAKWMTDETWFTADEAIAAGLADGLTEKVSIAAMAKFDLSAFKNAPKELVEASAEPAARTDDASGGPHSAIAIMETRLARREHIGRNA